MKGLDSLEGARLAQDSPASAIIQGVPSRRGDAHQKGMTSSGVLCRHQQQAQSWLELKIPMQALSSLCPRLPNTSLLPSWVPAAGGGVAGGSSSSSVPWAGDDLLTLFSISCLLSLSTWPLLPIIRSYQSVVEFQSGFNSQVMNTWWGCNQKVSILRGWVTPWMMYPKGKNPNSQWTFTAVGYTTSITQQVDETSYSKVCWVCRGGRLVKAAAFHTPATVKQAVHIYFSHAKNAEWGR